MTNETDNTAPEKYETFNGRLTIVAALLFAAFFALGWRLWELQVVEANSWTNEAEKFRLYPQRLESRRGIIYGTAGDETVVIADNRPAYDIMMVRAMSDEPEKDANSIATLLGMSPEDTEAFLGRLLDPKVTPYEQIVVKRDVGKGELMRVEETLAHLPGVFPVTRPQRRYPYHETAGSLLGYLGEIGPTELASNRDRYKMGDVVGKSGIEAIYEDAMRGRDGQMLVNVYRTSFRPEPRTDAYGNPYFDLDRYGNPLEEEIARRKEPVPGEAVYTTIDVNLQKFCEQLLEGQIGAIAVLEANTGAVLALASQPTYDPSVFVSRDRSRERQALFEKKPNPMINRAYQERYPPGSTYKVMLAAAALEEGVIDENTRFYCPGYFRLPGGSRPWRCWRHSGHGSVNVREALAYSCDVFFYNVGRDLGVDKIKEWSTRMGLGVKSGIDLTGEVEGVIPDPAWRETVMKNIHPDDPSEWRWYPGHTINLSIGQGDAVVTPLQIAVMMACVVNDGRHVRPHINRDHNIEISEPFISEKSLEIIRDGMRTCVEKVTFPSGTGRLARVEDVVVLGKTGTAQVVNTKHYAGMKEADIPYELRDHAWFVCGTPEEETPLAIAVLVEHGLHGSSGASPLAKEIIEYFYKGDTEYTPVNVLAAQDN